MAHLAKSCPAAADFSMELPITNEALNGKTLLCKWLIFPLNPLYMEAFMGNPLYMKLEMVDFPVEASIYKGYSIVMFETG